MLTPWNTFYSRVRCVGVSIGIRIIRVFARRHPQPLPRAGWGTSQTRLAGDPPWPTRETPTYPDPLGRPGDPPPRPDPGHPLWSSCWTLGPPYHGICSVVGLSSMLTSIQVFIAVSLPVFCFRSAVKELLDDGPTVRPTSGSCQVSVHRFPSCSEMFMTFSTELMTFGQN